MAKLILTQNFRNPASADYFIYRSTDGVTFTGVDVDFRPTLTKTLSISNAISVGFKETSSLIFEARYSNDSGVTWLEPTGLPLNSNRITLISLDPTGANSAYLYLTDSSSGSVLSLLYKTLDGGASWSLVSTTPPMRKVSWNDANTGYGLQFGVTNFTVRKTTDGGLTWNVVNNTDIPRLVNSNAFMYIKSFASGVVYIYGIKNSNSERAIWKSSDSGVTFAEQGFDNELSTVKALNETTLYATTSNGFGGFLKVSTDSGVTFNPTTMPAVNGAYFISATEGYTSINGNIYSSTDLGASSSLVTSPTLPAGTWFSTEIHMVDEVSGCTNPNAYNHNSLATFDDGSCDLAFKLTDTQGVASDIIVQPSLGGPDPLVYLGQAIKVNGDDSTCYIVSYSPTNAGAVALTTIDVDFVDAATCELTIPQVGPADPNAYNYDGSTVSDGSELYAYRLVDSRGIENDIVTDTDFSIYIGQTVKLNAPYEETCYEVAYETDITGITLIPVVLDSNFVDSPTCELTLSTGYLLTDVAGNAPTIVTGTNLSSYVGQVVKVNGARICYLVAVNPDLVGAIPVNVYSDFADGATCLLTLEAVSDFECPEDEVEEEVAEPAPIPKPVSLNSYYQSRYKLDQIVREYIIERGEDTEHSYPRLLQLAVNGLRELNMDISGSNKMVVLSIKDDMTVDLPSDFINYTRIAICGSHGELMSLGHNPNLCKPRYADDCGNITHKQSTVGNHNIPVYIDNIASHYRNGEMVGRFYGEGGGYNANGQYVLDKERGVIQLSSVSAEEIVLEYIADITKIDGSFRVHPYIIETLKAYMAWSSIRRKRAESAQEKELARRDYYNERRIASVRFNSFTMEEAKATIRKAFKLSPKL